MRPNPFSSQFRSLLGITVTVGTDPHQQSFTVHQIFICCQSNYFKKAITGECLESEFKPIILPEDGPNIFAQYLKLLYTQKLPIKLSDEPKPDDSKRDEWVSLSKV
ncbi:hypothetical protein K469DRAFT_600831 [Zopfia rhizophila CBS 207.26]|uniref:BTB domain-containing protein n=1 Tax=Zopfia rhizophila CBS 207.26 TaxID=1314779 RepID=A0A6A6DHX8_9PEZI|nr:hypothetical protein K469DRAFT_600831 [Zopfia rhizophila CBS 207.26]